MRPKHFIPFVFLLVSLFDTRVSAEPVPAPTSDESIIATIVSTRQELLDLAAKNNRAEQPVFLTFWDFDGTILKGDCSEGLEENGQKVYPGLAEVGINHGLSMLYAPEDGYQRFSDDYHYMEQRVGRWLAYPFIGQVFRGAKLQSLHDLAAQHFQTTLRDYYFKSSVSILKKLQQLDVEVHIITASTDFFVTPAAPTLDLPPANVHGIQYRVSNGILTEEIIYPVTLAEGKTATLREIVRATEQSHPNRPVFVLAAFGNSYETDGPFLKCVAEQKLPAGKPLSVMINGGEAPAAYRNLFLEVIRTETVK